MGDTYVFDFFVFNWMHKSAWLDAGNTSFSNV